MRQDLIALGRVGRDHQGTWCAKKATTQHVPVLQSRVLQKGPLTWRQAQVSMITCVSGFLQTRQAVTGTQTLSLLIGSSEPHPGPGPQ